jgi:DNA-binding beta-propeller fold protein YncE
MKSSFARTIASSVLCLFLAASASFAATKPPQPVNAPRGLALDLKGNLYVANSGANNILIYNPNYVQTTSKTITQGVSNPTGVAFDGFGNLWVANYGTSNGGPTGSISEYTGGKQNTSGTITNSILGPVALAIDGAGDLWVDNAYSSLISYTPTGVFAPPSTPFTVFTPSGPIYGIAAGAGTVAWGGPQTTLVSLFEFLYWGSTDYSYYGKTGFSLANDASGNLYLGNLDGSVNVYGPQVNKPFTQLLFVPYGIAVDSVRGRVYFSNYNGNSIVVYSTAGALLKTIQ